MKKIVAFGNPLLDTIVLLKDDTLLKKFTIESDGQKEICKAEMEILKKDIESFEKTVTAGGCAQNTLKVLRWLLKENCCTTIFGAVGKDKEGQVLREILKNHGVETCYVVHDDLPTGSSVALTLGDDRALLAHLGAAEILSLNDFKANREILSRVELANLIYFEGFFLTKRLQVSYFILEFCKKANRKVAFNLSGRYLCEAYPEAVEHFVTHSDIIFGNRKEFEALASILKHDCLNSLLVELGNSKVIVMTNASSSVLCVKGGTKCDIEVPPLQPDELVDTTGAGDSFVAGFLCGFLQEKPVEICLELGCKTAREIIKRRGCTVPEHSII